MTSKLKVKFIDWSPGYNTREKLIYRLLSEKYDIELSDTPDYVFDGGLGCEHINYDCIKILFVGENIVPDFNCFDYAVGFDHLDFGDRYVRVPLFAFYNAYTSLISRTQKSDDFLLNRDFCSIVVSNGAGNPIRQEFFERLSKYKPVASGGRFLNNVGGPVEDKLKFCEGFKFNIAFENSDSPGYTTEKIMQAFAAHTVPIYWGDPLVDKDFNLNSFVRLVSKDTMEDTIEHIVECDKHDDLYLKMCRQNCFSSAISTNYHKILQEFLFHIMEQPLETAKRLHQFGYQPFHRRNQAQGYILRNTLRKIRRFLSR